MRRLGSLGAAAIALVLAGPASAAPQELESRIGKIRVAGSSRHKIVSVVTPVEALPLVGEPLPELLRLHGAEVEVVGKRVAADFEVAEYRILDVGGGAKPMVGILILSGDNFGLSTGKSDPIPLSIAPRTARRLVTMAGAKVWVSGKTLVSGQLEVLQYGILRDPTDTGATPSPTEPGADEAPQAP